MSQEDDRSDPGREPDYGDAIDPGTFEQILEMDDDGDREFSRGIVYGFFEQFESTYADMERDVQSGNLDALSRLGHFLKGSSATLGLTKVRDICEKIQNWGALKSDGSSEDLERNEALDQIKAVLTTLNVDYQDVKMRLVNYYDYK